MPASSARLSRPLFVTVEGVPSSNQRRPAGRPAKQIMPFEKHRIAPHQADMSAAEPARLEKLTKQFGGNVCGHEDPLLHAISRELAVECGRVAGSAAGIARVLSS